ncbi:MAG: hypothetical protein P1U88_20875, partial [Thalassobaculaceae bacterium]|nr:hypothetical protein [Thalassobaculaceae bacterium]
MAKDTPAVSDAAERIVDRSLWAVAAALCFALVQKFGSLHVPPPEALDDAWQLAMQFAWLNGLQFGHDIVFPHGPYGGFYGQVYNPDLIGLLYLINLPYALLLAICVVWTLRVRAGSGVLRSMLASALAILTAAAITLGSDGIWMLPSFLLMGLALDDRKTPAALLVMLILVIALGALAKLSFLMMGLTALIAWTAAAAARRDRLAPAALPLFAAAVAGLWLAAGQSPGGFVDWVGVSLQVASGYAAAMSLTSDWSDLAVFAALAACLLSGLWIEFRRETRGFVKLVVMLGWVGLFLLVAKAGFVRHDGHGVFPFQMLAATGAMVVARLLPVARRKVRAVTIQAIALVA